MIAKRRWIARMLLVIALVLVGLAAVPAQATCVGIDLTVTVWGQSQTLLTNGCGWCAIGQGPNTIWANPFGLPMNSVQFSECLR